MTKTCLMTLLFLLVSAISNAASPDPASSTAFYGKPAAWLFDLITNPTSLRHFQIYYGSELRGCTQLELGKFVECTIHGKTASYPTNSNEAVLELCTVSSDSLRTIIGEGEASVSFTGNAAKEIFALLPNQDYSSHIGFEKVTVTQKSFGRSGIDGISCNEAKPDDATELNPIKYGCSIAWRSNSK